MKTLIALLLACVAALASPGALSAKPLIVCSTTQVADFARQVVGEHCEVNCVLAPGADPHLYETTASDARLVGQADLCLQNGMHLEGSQWMEKLTQAAGKPLVTCTDGIKPIRVDNQGGKQTDDPHTWFSPRNAAVYVNNITRAAIQLDPAHKDEYVARAKLYLAQLRTLDQWVKEQLSQIPPSRRILVTSHDAFNYFCDSYGFQSAAPLGWTTEEVGGGLTAGRRRQVVESIRKFGVPAIFVETSVNPKLIREIADEAGVRVGGELYSDSLGPTDSLGGTYLGMMRENVMTIVRSLK